MIEFSPDMGLWLIKSNASDLDVARAAWVSVEGTDAREKESGRVPGLINFLYRNRHMSPFEHGSFTFMVECPIFVAREFHRHRTFSYNEVSGRYTVLKPKFYLPPPGRPLVQTGKVGAYEFSAGDQDMYDNVEHYHMTAATKAWNAYELQLQLGVAKEVARMVLPLSIFTSFYATCNPRNLMQFLDLRTASDAMAEIRAVAGAMEVHFEEQMPHTYGAWRNGNTK